MKHILIVENDKKLATTLSAHLQSKQFLCVCCSSVEAAINELEKFSYDLVLLDRILSDGDGLEVAQFLSDYSFQTKILVLSELSQINDRIKGLEEGADEYLPKPFSLTELTLKINKLLQTQKMRTQEQLSLGKILIHPDSGELIINGKSYQIRKKEIQLLTCLVRHKNQVVSRDKIIDIVWSGNYDVPTQSTLDVYVRRLRISLGKYKNYIKTVRGFGYMALE